MGIDPLKYTIAVLFKNDIMGVPFNLWGPNWYPTVGVQLNPVD